MTYILKTLIFVTMCTLAVSQHHHDTHHDDYDHHDHHPATTEDQIRVQRDAPLDGPHHYYGKPHGPHFHHPATEESDDADDQIRVRREAPEDRPHHHYHGKPHGPLFHHPAPTEDGSIVDENRVRREAPVDGQHHHYHGKPHAPHFHHPAVPLDDNTENQIRVRREASKNRPHHYHGKPHGPYFHHPTPTEDDAVAKDGSTEDQDEVHVNHRPALEESQPRVRRQTSENENEEIAGLVKSMWVPCDFTTTPKFSCYNCNTRMICKPYNGAIVKPCYNSLKPYCNGGICSSIPSNECRIY